jgi:hypothetical protein
MRFEYLILVGVGLGIWVGATAAQAQGISNARDGSGNLIDRGAATRSYPTTPARPSKSSSNSLPPGKAASAKACSSPKSSRSTSR